MGHKSFCQGALKFDFRCGSFATCGVGRQPIALIEATALILVREGFDRTSTNRIAEVTGVSVGWLCQYYPGKTAAQAPAKLIARKASSNRPRTIAFQLFLLQMSKIGHSAKTTLPVRNAQSPTLGGRCRRFPAQASDSSLCLKVAGSVANHAFSAPGTGRTRPYSAMLWAGMSDR